MNNRTITFFLVFILLLSACTTTQKTVDTHPKPEWVQQRPINSIYYIGISSATKKGFSPASYMATAKQNAISDLSSEISINIESTSLFNAMQTLDRFSQQFVSDIKASNTMQLEGYELVATYEDNDNYWVYYQLSKQRYQEWKEQKKQQAVSDAKNKYLQGENMLQNQQHYNAFKYFAEALEILSPYLNENTACTLENEQIDLGSTIYNQLINILTTCSVTTEHNTFIVKKGVAVADNLFCFSVNDRQGNAMASFPVKINFSGSGLLKNSEKTGSDGRFCCSFQKIKTNRLQETLSLSIDATTLSRVITNHLVRNIIKNIPTTETTIRVSLQKPSLQIVSNEKSLNRTNTEQVLYQHISEVLTDHFVLTETSSSDFILKIESNTIQKEKYNNLYYIDIECSFTLNDANGNNLYRKRFKEEASGENPEIASQNGYQTMITAFERTVKRDIENVLD